MASLSRTSSAVSVQPLRHVTTDYPPPSLQRTYSRNIMNLEQMAEDMSQGGSDIGEEIRRMNEEQKQRSRQSSVQSSHQGESSGVRGGAFATGFADDTGSRSRAGSNGVVDAARWAGYSPNRYGSARSGSGWSQPSMHRKTSATGSSRLAQMVEPTREGKPLDSPLAPGGSLYSTSPPEQEVSRQPSQNSFSRHYDQIAGQIEESLEHVPPSPPKHSDHLPESHEQRYMRPVTPPLRPRSADTFQEAQTAFKDFDGVHFSPDTDEFVELDENGNEIRRVSARSSSGALSVSAASMLRTPRARPTSYARPMAYAEPPPADGMVYYPAPVPRMLNLPKRLSQLPAAKVQAKRRTQILSQIDPDVVHGAPWIPRMEFDEDGSRQSVHSREGSGSQAGQPLHSTPPRPYLNERMSVANMQSLPPQLRASVFFDQQSVQHNVEVKNQSAVATLDDILAASATAPVSAFTDHPFAGDVRRHTFAPEELRARRSTTTLASGMLDQPEKVKRRSSFGNLLRRNSSGNDLAEQLDRRGSRSSTLLDFNEGGRKLQKRQSQMSLGDEVQRQADAVRTPGNEISEPDLRAGLIGAAQNASSRDAENEYQRVASGSRPGTAGSWQNVEVTQRDIDDDFKEAEAAEDVDDTNPMYVQPSTLLAELQVRKANQKSRNRTAATHYPNGMHSTLLQLDAVEQINKDKRKRQKIPLAWEGQSQRQEEQEEQDDEVPLGVLYPSKDGLTGGKKKVGDGRDFSRPLGLMEKRELEDSEPLASRRNRMLGLPPSFGRAEREAGRVFGGPQNLSQMNLAGQPDAPSEGYDEGEAEDYGEGETLADRLKKLKTKDALATAVSDVIPKDGSRPASTFSADVLGQFGPLDDAEQEGARGPGTKGEEAVEESAEAGAQEEETLGQRRARLQREREADEDTPLATLVRPGAVRASSSFANLLAANPVGARKASKEHKLVQGTLLHASAIQQAKQKQQLASTNIRSASYYGIDAPFVDDRPQSARQPSTHGLLGAQAGGHAPAGGFAGGMYNNGLGGIAAAQAVQTSASTPMFGMGGQNSYFPSPTAGVGSGASMMGYNMQQPRHQAMLTPMSYQSIGMQGGSMTSYGFPSAMAVSGYGAPQMQMPSYVAGVGMGTPMGPPGMMEDPMDAGKRAGIDQWRSSIMH